MQKKVRGIFKREKKIVSIINTKSILIFEKNTIVIKPLVSEAPVQNIKDMNTLTIEKMFVDIFCDDIIFST